MYWAQNLRHGIVMKTSFKTRVSRMGLGSFVDINISVMIYYFIWFLHILHFYRIASIKIHTNVKTPKRKLGSFVQRYSFKFWALEYLFVQCTAHTGVFICTVYCTHWAQNLRHSIVMKTSFKTRVSRMGLGSFVDINIFAVKYYFI